MDDKDRQLLEHMSETIDKIYAKMTTPESRIDRANRIINIVAAGFAILGGIAIIDVILKWIGG